MSAVAAYSARRQTSYLDFSLHFFQEQLASEAGKGREGVRGKGKEGRVDTWKVGPSQCL